eukprot:3247770-Pleurochrysis_carterae.AAC.1
MALRSYQLHDTQVLSALALARSASHALSLAESLGFRNAEFVMRAGVHEQGRPLRDCAHRRRERERQQGVAAADAHGIEEAQGEIAVSDALIRVLREGLLSARLDSVTFFESASSVLTSRRSARSQAGGPLAFSWVDATCHPAFAAHFDLSEMDL